MKLFKSAMATSVALSLLAFSTHGFAGKDTGVTGSLTMMMDPIGTYALATATVEGSLYPSYGDVISFDVVLEGKVSRNSWTYVTVVCRQDDVVFQASNWTDFTFTMEDLAGQGLEWDGYPADCTASLIYRVEKGKTAELTYLDSVSFTVN